MASRLCTGRGKIGAMFNLILVFSIIIVYYQLYLLLEQRGRVAQRLAVIKYQLRQARPTIHKMAENMSHAKLETVAPGKPVSLVVEARKKEEPPSAKLSLDAAKNDGTKKSPEKKPTSAKLPAKNDGTKKSPEKTPQRVPPKQKAIPVPQKVLPKKNVPPAKPSLSGVKDKETKIPPQKLPPPKSSDKSRANSVPLIKDQQNKIPPSKQTQNNQSNVISEVNPHPYYFVLNHPYKCKNQDVFLLIIVTSSPQNAKLRQSIRETWGNESNVPGVIIKTMFAMGKTNSVSTQKAIEQEDKIHRDILQENFVDSYHNLTYKTIMCLKYSFKFCPRAKYLLKTDDDTIVNVPNLVAYLKELGKTKKGRIVVGEVWKEGKPVQGQRRKWPVPTDGTQRPKYPKYPNGFAYVISNDITWQVFTASLNIKNFFLEDVYIGLCLEKLGIELIDNPNFYNNYVNFNPCRHQNLIASHWVKEPVKMKELWRAMNHKCDKR